MLSDGGRLSLSGQRDPRLKDEGRLLREDARFCSLGAGAEADSISAGRKGSPQATRRQVLTSRPLLQCVDSNPPGCDLSDRRPAPGGGRSLPRFPQRLAGSWAPPSRAGQSALRVPALARATANVSAPATGHRPREGGGRRGRGRVRPPGGGGAGARRSRARRRGREGRDGGAGL